MNPESQQEFPNASELLMCEKYGHAWDDDKCTKYKETRLCSPLLTALSKRICLKNQKKVKLTTKMMDVFHHMR
jgi:hypothetical protein